MTTAEALLAVLAPLGTFFSGLATLSVKRHFRFVDGLETKLGSYLEKSAESQARVAEEMRLSRVARESQDAQLGDLIGELEEGLGRKIDDKRFSELRAAVEELRAKRAKSDPPKAEDSPVPAEAEVTEPKRTRTEGRGRPVAAEARPAPRGR